MEWSVSILAFCLCKVLRQCCSCVTIRKILNNEMRLEYHENGNKNHLCVYNNRVVYIKSSKIFSIVKISSINSCLWIVTWESVRCFHLCGNYQLYDSEEHTQMKTWCTTENSFLTMLIQMTIFIFMLLKKVVGSGWNRPTNLHTFFVLIAYQA